MFNFLTYIFLPLKFLVTFEWNWFDRGHLENYNYSNDSKTEYIFCKLISNDYCWFNYYLLTFILSFPLAILIKIFMESSYKGPNCCPLISVWSINDSNRPKALEPQALH